MNKDNAAAYLPLVQALSEGKVIESLAGDTNWETLTEVNFNMAPNRYRIRPEPHRFWIATTDQQERIVFDEHRSVGSATDMGRIISIKPVIEILDSKETP